MCTVEPMDWAKDWALLLSMTIAHDMMALALTGGQGFSGWDAETHAAVTWPLFISSHFLTSTKSKNKQ